MCTYDTIIRRKAYRSGYVEALESRIVQLSRLVLKGLGDSLPSIPKILLEEDFGQTLLQLSASSSHHEDEHFLSMDLRSPSMRSLSPIDGNSQPLGPSNAYHDRSASGENTLPGSSSHRIPPSSLPWNHEPTQLYSTQKRVRVEADESAVPKNAATLRLELRDEQLCAVNVEIVEYFFETLHNVLPLFHHQTFLQQLVPENQHSSLLLMSMYSLALHAALAYGDLKHMNLTQESVDTICSTAIRLVPRYLDEPTLSTVQACMILSYLCYAKDNLALSWLLHGIAMRFAIRLGLNKDVSMESNLSRPFVELEIRRRAWWMAFNLVSRQQKAFDVG